jgi:cytochrome c5
MHKLLLALAVAAALTACGRHEAKTASSSDVTAPSTTAAAPAPSSTTDTSAATSTADAGSASNTTVMGAGADGATVFKNTCSMCHAAGVAGAPKVGDKADWGPRIAQGKDTLYNHALHGFTGKKGMMPPKGGNASLPDADVKAAVDYMVSQAK